MAATHAVWRALESDLGRISGTQRFSDLERHPENDVLLGIRLFREEASLVYLNVKFVRQVAWQRSGAAPAPIPPVFCDRSNSA
jgi:sulfate permease, SulP family